jgi:hypothetical protein
LACGWIAAWRLGLRWMAEIQPHDEELDHFRAEAAALLGLPTPHGPIPEKAGTRGP